MGVECLNEKFVAAMFLCHISNYNVSLISAAYYSIISVDQQPRYVSMTLKQTKKDVFRAKFFYFPKDIGDIYTYADIISDAGLFF